MEYGYVTVQLTSLPGVLQSVDSTVGVQAGAVEAVGGVECGGFGGGAGVALVAADGGFAGADARRVGDGEVVVEDDPELDDPEEEQAEHRQQCRELDQGLAAFVARSLLMSLHCRSLLAV